MLNFIKKLFSVAPKPNLAELIKNGALIVDVRSKGEYQGGHVKGSINIPLDVLNSNLSKIAKDKTIITCCASGMRSGSAKRILLAKGYAAVHNGGSWMVLNRYN